MTLLLALVRTYFYCVVLIQYWNAAFFFIFRQYFKKAMNSVQRVRIYILSLFQERN